MGKLKPIGSEKLVGEAKIKRIIEISNFGRTNSTIKEDPLKTEFYKITLPDGFDYRIILEKNGYVIQKGLNEDYNYLDRMENISHSKSFSGALSKLNLIVSDINRNFNHDEEINLFEQKKYVLKTPVRNNNTNKEENISALDPIQPSDRNQLQDIAPIPNNAPPEPINNGETDNSPNLNSPKEEDSNEISFREIQKITGRLAQKIREFEDSSEFGSKDIKYVINSILSAMDLNKLDDNDMDQILKRFDSVKEKEEDAISAPLEETAIDVDFNEEAMDEIFKESKVDKVISKYLTNSNGRRPQKSLNSLQDMIRLVESSSRTKKQYHSAINFMRGKALADFKGLTNKGNLIFESKNRIYKINQEGKVK